MREILFRGKRLDNGGWIEGHLADMIMGVRGFQDRAIIVPFETSLAIACDPATVGQYTGLKDRNGVEIWEDDIMRIPETDFNAEIIGRVIYEEDAYYIIPLNGGHLWGLCWSLRKHNAKIIGNIHDNADLIK